jgi:hypothetical protein
MTMKLCKPDMLEWVASEKYIHPSFGIEYGHGSIQRSIIYIYSDMCESVYTHTQRCVEIYFQHILNIYTACCIKKRMILYVHKIAHCSWDDQAVAREGATAWAIDD